ncbi:Sak single strand annealing protein, partial [Escherichia sp. SS-MK2]
MSPDVLNRGASSPHDEPPSTPKGKGKPSYSLIWFATIYFTTLSQIDCTEHLEKKGKFSYLSWAWTVKRLREVAPTATWHVKRFDGV